MTVRPIALIHHSHRKLKGEKTGIAPNLAFGGSIFVQ